MSEQAFTNIHLPPAVIEFCEKQINIHRVIWFLTCVSFFIAWNRGLALLYALFSLLITVLLLSYLLPPLQLRKLNISMRPLGKFSVGHVGTIEYSIDSPSMRYHLLLHPELPFCDEKTGNIFFSQVDTKQIQSVNVMCNARGCFRINEITVSSAYPFGIFTFSKKIPLEPTEFLVFPSCITLYHTPKAHTADNISLGDVLIRHTGGQGDFASIREYRQGDELRHVHWLASARNGTLIIKEYERSDKPTLLIALNNNSSVNVGEGNNSTFEVSIRITAALVELASQLGVPCYIVGHDDEPWQMNIPSYTTDFYSLYEQLARTHTSANLSYDSIVEEALHCYPHANLLVTFCSDEFKVNAIVSPRITHIDLIMVSNGFRFPAQSHSQNTCHQQENKISYLINAASRLEGLFR